MHPIQVDLSGFRPGLIRAHREKSQYSTFDTTGLNDERLSHKGVGILFRLLNHADTWQVSERQLSKGKTKRTSSRSGLHELEELGYLVRIEVREKGQFLGIASYVFERPVNPAQLVLPHGARTLAGKRRKRQGQVETPPAQAPEAEKQAPAVHNNFLPAGSSFSVFGLAAFGKSGLSHIVGRHIESSQLVEVPLPPAGAPPSPTHHTRTSSAKPKKQRPPNRAVVAVDPVGTRPAYAGGADAPKTPDPQPSTASTTPLTRSDLPSHDQKNVPGAGAGPIGTPETLRRLMGTKRVLEPGGRGLASVDCLPDLLGEPGRHGADRGQWLTLDELVIRDDATACRLVHKAGKGNFRTLLIDALDLRSVELDPHRHGLLGKALDAMKPPVPAPAAPVVDLPDDAPAFTISAGQVWHDRKTGDRFVIDRVEEKFRDERRSGVVVKIKVGSFMVSTEGKQVSAGVFPLQYEREKS